MRPVEKLFAEQFVRGVIARNPSEPEFHQAVQEVVESLVPVLERHTKYLDHRILERIVEPERVILHEVAITDVERAPQLINDMAETVEKIGLSPFKF